MSAREHLAAIVGAGPYGLATAAHLRSRGVGTRTFGEPMEFWLRQMPRAMRLRSSKRSSSIGSPNVGFSLGDYAAQAGREIEDPIPAEDFIAYGRWFQRRVAPECDSRRVVDIAWASEGFSILLDDGHSLRARHVVVAGGIGPFAYVPEVFRGLPSEVATHSAQHVDFDRFAGKRVVVIGSGQSAFESAALLSESDAEVEIVARSPRVIWLSGGAARRLPRNLLSMIDPGTDVGPLGLDQIAARPWIFASLPYALQGPIYRRCVRPAAAGWLRTRVDKVRVTTSAEVVRASSIGRGVKIDLSDGTSRLADHLLLSTGYRVDISKYPFISPTLHRLIASLDGYPLLNRRFEASVDGLFFAGAPATLSLGPLFRFVAGTQYCAAAISQAIARNLGLPWRHERPFATDSIHAR